MGFLTFVYKALHLRAPASLYHPCHIDLLFAQHSLDTQAFRFLKSSTPVPSDLPEIIFLVLLIRYQSNTSSSENSSLFIQSKVELVIFYCFLFVIPCMTKHFCVCVVSPKFIGSYEFSKELKTLPRTLLLRDRTVIQTHVA